MSGRHLRRGRAWWVRRALVLLVVAVLGAAIGAGVAIALDRADDDEAVDADEGVARLEPTTGPVTIALGGEVSAGAALGERLAGPPSGLLGPLAEVVDDAHLIIVDLSAAVTGGEPTEPGEGSWAPVAVLDALEAAGVDVVSVANDRSLDQGPAAIEAARAATEQRRLAVVGLGADEDEAYAPALRQLGGRTVAVLAATQELAPERIATDTAEAGTPGVASAKRVDRLVQAVEDAAGAADVVIVYVHWGTPGEACPDAGQVELASALVAAGADVVAGTGSGIVQGAGRLGDGLVVYGLGGLVVDGGAEAGAVVVEVDEDGLSGWRWTEGSGDPGELEARQACAGLVP